MNAENLKIDPNTADIEALTEIKGIGPNLAELIIAARPFDSVDDMVRVNGIGGTFLNSIRLQLEISPAGEAAQDPEAEAQMEKPQPGEEAKTEEVELEGEEEAQVEPESKKTPTAGPESWAEVISENAFAETKPETWEKAIEEEVTMGAGTGEPETTPEKVLQAVKEKSESQTSTAQEPVETSSPEEDIEPSEAFIDGDKLVAHSAPREEAKAEAPKERPVSQPALVTRSQALWMVIGGSFFALIISLFLSLSILASLNRGQLQYTLPSQYSSLALRVHDLESQTGNLKQEIDGMRARVDNLETLGERVSEMELTTESLREEVQAARAQTAKLSGKIQEMHTALDKFQTFFEGLRVLMTNLFAEEVQ